MNEKVPREVLESLPEGLWMPCLEGPPSIYRGKPLEVLRLMAEEVGECDLERAVDKILQNLARHRRFTIRLPSGLSEESLSQLFVYSLLSTGILRELPRG